jgi:hypothetical protein
MSLVRRYSQAGLAVILLVAAVSCETKRTEMGPVRRSFGFDGSMWGGQGGGEKTDEKEIKSTYANAGWNVDEDGNIKGAKNKDLYTEKSRSGKKSFAKKEARLKKRDLTREVYRTPEYLERQKYDASKSAKEGKLVSRDANFDQNRTAETGQTAQESGADSPGFLNALNPFRNRTAQESGGTYRTAANREASRAQANIAVPVPGNLPRDGDLRSAALTMDDVKKMLNPEAFD